MNPIVLHWVTTNLDRNISRNKEIYQQCLIFIFIKYSRHATTISGILFLSSSSSLVKTLAGGFLFYSHEYHEGRKNKSLFIFFQYIFIVEKSCGRGVVKIVTAELCCLWRKEEAFLHYSYLKSLYSCLSFMRRTTDKKCISLEKSVHDKIPVS